jgi:glutamine synthetase
MDTTGTRLRLLWSDLHGIERGKYLHGNWQERGRANFCLATFPLTFDREILPIPALAFDVGLPDLEATVETDTLRTGWEPNTTVGIGRLSHQQKPVGVDPRYLLEQAVAPWLERGLRPQVAFEFEFYLQRPDGEGGWLPLATPSSRVYGTGTAVDPDGVVAEIVDNAARAELDVEAWCTEFDDSQFEINIHYRDAVPAADDAFLFRVLAHEIATRCGHRATFIGRPFGDRGGSGLHVNISFRDAHGQNALYDPSDPEGLSDLARSCMAGMLAHHEGTAAICAPTVNAYKRLLPDMMNGYWANWGHDDRTVAVRISPERGATTRLENRVPDGACNPYLASAALLHACRFGVEDGLTLPPAQPVGEAPAATQHVPADLEQAVDAMRADLRLCEALGAPLVEAFSLLKLAEWQRYVAAAPDHDSVEPTRWELDYYTPFF